MTFCHGIVHNTALIHCVAYCMEFHRSHPHSQNRGRDDEKWRR